MAIRENKVIILQGLEWLGSEVLITTRTKGHRPAPNKSVSGYDVQEVIDAIDYWKAHDVINSTIPSRFLNYAMNPEGFDNELYFNMTNSKQKEIANNSKCIAVAMWEANDIGGRCSKAFFKDEKKNVIHMRTYYPDNEDMKVLLSVHNNSERSFYKVKNGKIAQNAKCTCPAKLLELVYESLTNE